MSELPGAPVRSYEGWNGGGGGWHGQGQGGYGSGSWSRNESRMASAHELHNR
jgi:hypothetical protein